THDTNVYPANLPCSGRSTLYRYVDPSLPLTAYRPAATLGSPPRPFGGAVIPLALLRSFSSVIQALACSRVGRGYCSLSSSRCAAPACSPIASTASARSSLAWLGLITCSSCSMRYLLEVCRVGVRHRLNIAVLPIL